MADFAKALGASKGASSLLVLFIPSQDRTDAAIDQGYWVDEALKTLGTLFGGATAFPQGKGVWRDDAQGGKLLFDEPVIIQCYASEPAIESRAADAETVPPPHGPRGQAGSHRAGHRPRLPGDRLPARRTDAAQASERQETEVTAMAKNIKSIADRLGAKIVGQVPNTGGGAFGAARLARMRREPPGPAGAGTREATGPAERCQLGTPSQSAHERRYPAASAPPGRRGQRQRPQGQPHADRRPNPGRCGWRACPNR